MKILIVKMSAAGDLIHTFPVVSYLRQRFPSAEIDWIVEASLTEIIEAHPHVNRVLTVESKKWLRSCTHWQEIKAFRASLHQSVYDVVFDLQGNIKSAMILAQVRAKIKVGFGWKTLSEWPNALFTTQKINPPQGRNIREDYLSIVQSYFKDENFFPIEPIKLRIHDSEQPLIKAFPSGGTMVCPGTAWPNKQLSYEQIHAFLKILGKSFYIFIWGNQKEKEISMRLVKNFSGSLVLERYRLPVLQHMMAKSLCVIAMDSLPLHLCGTTQTPTIGFFGPSLAKKYGPIGEMHRKIQGDCPYKIKFEKRCPKLRTCKTGACLKTLVIDETLI
ncbi:MAG: glycosyltransferase family 9 protein [Chlamydiales bacterium]